MSLILLGLSTLETNDGKVPICNLAVRNETCGGNFNCHYRGDEEAFLKGLQLDEKTYRTLKNNFALPQKWFCSEFTLFSMLRLKKEDEKSPFEMFFSTQEDKNLNQNKTNKLTYEHDQKKLEEEITSQESIRAIYEYLENNQFRCYYTMSKPYKEGEQVSGFEMIVCYQDANTTLEPNEDFKVILDIVYFLDGRVEVMDWIVSKEEDATFEKIVDFEKRMELDQKN